MSDDCEQLATTATKPTMAETARSLRRLLNSTSHLSKHSGDHLGKETDDHSFPLGENGHLPGSGVNRIWPIRTSPTSPKTSQHIAKPKNYEAKDDERYALAQAKRCDAPYNHNRPHLLRSGGGLPATYSGFGTFTGGLIATLAPATN